MFSLKLIPKVEERPTFSGSAYEWLVVSAPTAVLITATLAAMRQPRSTILRGCRALLLPAGLLSILKAATFRNVSTVPAYNIFNYAIGLFGFTASMKLIELTFLKSRPQRRVLKKHPIKKGDAPPASNGETVRTEQMPGIRDALSYLADPRGICWDTGLEAFFAPETRDLSNAKNFLRQTLWRAVTCFMIFDIAQTLLQCIPNTTLGTPQGGSIFFSHLSPIPRYAVSTILSVTTCWVIYFAMDAIHCMITIVAVGLFKQDPSEYPPLFWNPWQATSLRNFWSKRWHAAFKRNFWVVGGIPGFFVAGKIGAVIGVFLISGLLHDLTLWGMGKGFDPLRVTGFFLVHGVGIIIEGLWTAATGKRVTGLYGRIWTGMFLCVSGNLITEAWFQRGLAGGVYLVEDTHSPTRWLVHYIRPLLSSHNL